MKIYLGADHAGTRLKETVKRALVDDGHDVTDVSPSTPEGGDDYPDYAFQVAERVAAEQGSAGLLMCDTGIGMAIAANKVRGASAALVVDTFGAKRAREHNNANILVFGSELISPAAAVECARTFFATPFSDVERHLRRTRKITYYDTHQKKPS